MRATRRKPLSSGDLPAPTRESSSLGSIRASQRNHAGHLLRTFHYLSLNPQTLNPKVAGSNPARSTKIYTQNPGPVHGTGVFCYLAAHPLRLLLFFKFYQVQRKLRQITHYLRIIYWRWERGLTLWRGREAEMSMSWLQTVYSSSSTVTEGWCRDCIDIIYAR